MKVIQTVAILAVLIACSYSNPLRPQALRNALKNGLKYIGGTSSKTYRVPVLQQSFTVERVWPPLEGKLDGSDLSFYKIREFNAVQKMSPSLKLKTDVELSDEPSDVEKEWSRSHLKGANEKTVDQTDLDKDLPKSKESLKGKKE